MPKDNDSLIQRVWKKQFDDIMSDSFAKYAKYIIQDRALPDIRDGLKPVQRRILYGMNRLGLKPDLAYKKSASTVGEVIGKYHPHGDSSIYEALVRMSQWWKNNIPLVDMQGNNGSIDGDSPAAMRYTEARLSQFAYEMLTNIEKDTVKFIPNFDDAEIEPTVLPSLLPNLLVNGASGIAAGYATNIPTFNLSELIDAIIMRIDSPNCRLDSLMKVIPGPDFPTGGIIHDDGGIKESYETGRGKIVIRARIIEEPDKRKPKLVVTEIPFETNKALIIRSIEEIIAENKIASLNEVRDESDKNGIRIVLEYSGDAKNAESIKKYLLKNTQLQVNFNINNIVINNRKPVQMSLINYLDSYLIHANDIILKSSNFDLLKASNRLEIVLGLIKATSIIDQIVKAIRASDNKETAIKKLVDSFEFSQVQAEAIVQLRLYKLTNTDVLSLTEESNKLRAIITELKKIIKDQDYRNNYLKNILRNYKKTFKSPRKSEISGAAEKIVIDLTEVVENKEITLIVTRDGYLKSCSVKTVNLASLNNLKLKNEDAIISINKANSLDRLLLITAFGNFVLIPVHKIKDSRIKEQGVHINSLVTLRDNEKITFAMVIKSDDKNQDYKNQSIFLASKDGMVKRISLSDILSFKTTRPSVCMSLKTNDFLVDAKLVHKETDQVILFTKYGNALRFNLDEVSIIGLKGMGVRGIKLRNDDDLVNICIVSPDSKDHLVLIAKQGIKRIKVDNIITLGRSTMGKAVLSQIKSRPYEIITVNLIDGSSKNILLFDGLGTSKIIRISTIQIMDLDSRMSAPIIDDFNKSLVIDQTVIDDKSSESTSLFNNNEETP